MSRVESVYRVYAGPGGGHAMWGWLGWLLIKYQYRCLLPCTLAPGVSAVCREAGTVILKSIIIVPRVVLRPGGSRREVSRYRLLHCCSILLESRLSQPSSRLDKYYIFMNLCTPTELEAKYIDK